MLHHSCSFFPGLGLLAAILVFLVSVYFVLLLGDLSATYFTQRYQGTVVVQNSCICKRKSNDLWINATTSYSLMFSPEPQNGPYSGFSLFIYFYESSALNYTEEEQRGRRSPEACILYCHRLDCHLATYQPIAVRLLSTRDLFFL